MVSKKQAEEAVGRWTAKRKVALLAGGVAVDTVEGEAPCNMGTVQSKVEC